jgi:hypothetical protein
LEHVRLNCILNLSPSPPRRSQGNSKIKRITPEGAVTCFAGGSFGFRDGVGTEAQFASPYAVCWWRGRLLVADTGNHALREVDLSSAAVRTLAGGTLGYSNDLEVTALVYKALYASIAFKKTQHKPPPPSLP